MLRFAVGAEGPPIGDSFLGAFANFLHHQARVPSAPTIVEYLQEVARFCEGQGLPRPAIPMRLLAALKRHTQLHPVDKSKEAAPAELVCTLLTGDTVPMVVRAAVAAIWFGTFRGTDALTASSRKFDAMSLCRRDVAFGTDPATGQSYVRFFLRRGKALEKNQPSVRVVVQPTVPGAVDPVAILRAYCVSSRHFSEDEPFFRHPDGRLLSKPQVVAHIKRVAAQLGLNPALYALHSFRSGGNTIMWAHHVNPGAIRLNGGWLSEGGDAPYRRVNLAQASEAQAALALPAAGFGAQAGAVSFPFRHVRVVSASSPLVPASRL